MSPQENIAVNAQTEIATEAARRPAALTPPPPSQNETAALGVAISGFQEFTESGLGRLALTGCKVLLFNFALFAPIVALGWLLFA